MSRSNNTELTNPAKKFFEWDGENGGFRYYDKDAEKRIAVPLPFTFLVLDKLSTIAGFSDADNSGYWSNEIRDIKKDMLSVRTKKGLQMTALYEDVKKQLGASGADYAQSVYIAYMEGSELAIGNIKMKGAALSSWIEFCKKAKIYDTAVTVKDFTEGKKGKTVYQIPNFKLAPVKPETDEVAKNLDKELQEYLTAYLTRNSTTIASEVVPEQKPEFTSDAPMPEREEPFYVSTMSTPSNYDDSDIPF